VRREDADRADFENIKDVRARVRAPTPQKFCGSAWSARLEVWSRRPR
jgi:hypothetical protein